MKEAVVMMASGETIIVKAGKPFFDQLNEEIAGGFKWVIAEEGSFQIRHIAAVMLRDPVD